MGPSRVLKPEKDLSQSFPSCGRQQNRAASGCHTSGREPRFCRRNWNVLGLSKCRHFWSVFSSHAGARLTYTHNAPSSSPCDGDVRDCSPPTCSDANVVQAVDHILQFRACNVHSNWARPCSIPRHTICFMVSKTLPRAYSRHSAGQLHDCVSIRGRGR